MDFEQVFGSDSAETKGFRTVPIERGNRRIFVTQESFLRFVLAGANFAHSEETRYTNRNSDLAH
jgi:hypothetical protein